MEEGGWIALSLTHLCLFLHACSYPFVSGVFTSSSVYSSGFHTGQGLFKEFQLRLILWKQSALSLHFSLVHFNLSLLLSVVSDLCNWYTKYRPGWITSCFNFSIDEHLGWPLNSRPSKLFSLAVFLFISSCLTVYSLFLLFFELRNYSGVWWSFNMETPVGEWYWFSHSTYLGL